MTPGESTAIARGMVRLWPQPELDEIGIGAYAQSLLDSGCSSDAIEAAARLLHRQRTSQWRPMPAELIAAARDATSAARMPAALPAGGRETTKAETLGELSLLTITAAEARARYSARIRMSVDRVESGSMRHVSTILGIGPTTITGREPYARQLAEELLRRHDAAGGDAA